MSVLVCVFETSSGSLHLSQVTLTTNPRGLDDYKICPYALCYGMSLDLLIVEAKTGTVQHEVSFHKFLEVKDAKGVLLETSDKGVTDQGETVEWSEELKVTLDSIALRAWITATNFCPTTAKEVRYLDHTFTTPSSYSVNYVNGVRIITRLNE